MSGRFLFLLLLCAGPAACDRRAAGPSAGHLRVERVSPDPRTLLDAPAPARFCDRDGILTITGIGTPWSAALALRTAWPPKGSFTVDSTLGDIGTAALAVRAAGDSTTPALVARTGSVDLDSGSTLAGHFTVVAVADSDTTRLTGRFRFAGRDSTGCPGP